MNKRNNYCVVSATALAYVAKQLSAGPLGVDSFLDACNRYIDTPYKKEMETFFAERGHDMIDADLFFVKACLTRFGISMNPIKRVTTLTEKVEVLGQWREGTVSDIQAILTLQCTPMQVFALNHASNNPMFDHEQPDFKQYDKVVDYSEAAGFWTLIAHPLDVNE